MRKLAFRLVPLLLAAVQALSAQSTGAPIIAVKVGHLIDPAAGTVTNSQVILIQDGKITAVGSNVSVPANAQVIDLSKEWVMPGMVDSHTHITMNVPPSPSGESLWDSYLLKESSGVRTARGLHNAELALQSGFTALRDVGNNANYADIAVGQAIDKGWFRGPTIIGTGKIIAPFGGQSHGYSPEQGRFWTFEYIDADTPDEIRKAVHQNIYYGAGAIKLVADNSAFHYSEADIRAAAEETHQAGLALAVHVYGGQAARDVINGGADSVEHGFNLDDDTLKLMKAKGTYLVGTDFPYEHIVALGALMPGTPRENADKIIDRLRRAHQLGVKMAFGSDTVSDLPGKTRMDMVFDYLDVWQKAGIPNIDILRAWTTNGFDLLRLSEKRGPIAVGRAADMIALPANPMDDVQVLRKVNFVMKDGKVVRSF
jgi:imidazolonepropionase-like amidohydrolase